MVSFHLVKIAALLCTNSVVALPPSLESLTKKNKLTKKMIKEDVETMALLNKQINEMTRLMDQVKSTYEEKLSKISSLLEYTAGSCCDSSAPTSFPSKVPSESPTKTESFVPSSAPSKSSLPTPNCVGTDISAIADHITDIDELAMQGNYLLVSDGDNNNVNLLMRENYLASWSTVKVYEPSIDMNSSSDFGTKVALDDNHVAVTSEGYYQYDTGRLFIYDRATDTETIFENPGADLGSDLFGSAVAVSGSYIIIGARYDSSVAYRAGIVYIYEKNPGGDWAFSQSITAPDGRSNDNFGISVALDGNTIVVGATGAGPNASGAAYVYRKKNGTYEYFATLVPENGGGSDYFARSVATSTIPGKTESLIAVGSPFTDRTTSNVGSVYFYESLGDEVRLRTEISGTIYSQQFGYTVALEESRIAVSSIGRKVDIYEDKRSSIDLVGSMTSDANYFGTDMVISGNTVVAAGGYSWDQKIFQQTICGDL